MGQLDNIETEVAAKFPSDVKMTEKRSQVIVALKKYARPASVYELTHYMKSQLGLSITSMSVYRILQLLESCAVVLRLDSINKYISYPQLPDCTYAYLICKSRSSIEVTTCDPNTVSVFQEISQKSEFGWNSRNIELMGVCEHCEE